MKIKNSIYKRGFTIVELLVVIVVIGILATVIVTSYVGIQQRAAATTLQADLKSAGTQLEMDKMMNGSYPATEAAANGGRGLPKSTGTTYQYTVSGSDYYLSATSTAAGTLAYYISSTTGGVQSGVWSGHLAPGVKVWKQIAANYYGACGVSSEDKVYCWGNNAYGQLGNNSITESHVPVAVDTTGVLSGKTIKSVAVGEYHACAIASDNNAYCWGRNRSGQLGNSTTVESHVPVAVYTSGALSGKTVKAIDAGSEHSCVIASDDKAYCWGYNGNGEIGDGTSSTRQAPYAVSTSGVLSGKTIKSISATTGSTCAIASDDKAYCWGNNGYGRLGNNSTTESYIPVAVDTTGVLNGKTVKAISAGYYYVCAIASDNLPYCWGQGGWSALGNGQTNDSYVPVAVTTSGVLSGKTVKDISAGNNHACVIASDDKAYCWGRANPYGSLGNNTTVDSSVPVAVTATGVLNGKTIKTISAGGYFTVAIASDNLAYSWGMNDYGNLGNNSVTQSNVPTASQSPN